MESLRELIHVKPFPVSDSCPVQVKVNRFPIITKHRLKSPREKSSKDESKIGKVSLPQIQFQEDTESSECDLLPKDWEALNEAYGLSKHLREESDEYMFRAGPSACKAAVELDLDHLPKVIMEAKDEKLEESHALKRWEYWMKDKRRMEQYLSKRLQKSACTLLLQDSDKFRKGLEEKFLRTCAQIPEADKWRGHPYRWKAQIRLPNYHQKRNKLKPEITSEEYFAVKTKLDTGEVTEMEFIGIPKTIQKEKGLICNRPLLKNEIDFLRADEALYYRRRRKKLKPHDINMDELEVIGNKIFETNELGKEVSPVLDLPEINVIEAESEGPQDVPQSLFCLVIDDKEVTYVPENNFCQSLPKTLSCEVYFEVNHVGRLAKKVLRVENRGTMAVRYHWVLYKKDPEKALNLEKLEAKEHEPCFFFNKNSGFFLPGQICDLQFFHQSKFPGIRKEIWSLITDPPVSQNGGSCQVILTAITTEDAFQTKHPLEIYLDTRVRDTVVKSIIEMILRKTFEPTYNLRGLEYRTILSRKDMFEYNNPFRYYNSTIVNELYEIFKELSQNDRADWDLSLQTLVRLIRSQEADKKKNSFLYEVTEKAKLLCKPSYSPGRKKKTYGMAYMILCNMTSLMEDDYEYFRGVVTDEAEKPTESRASNSGYDVEEMGEFDYFNTMHILSISPVNFMFFKTLFFIKVYYRLCEAVELIAGVLETDKLFEQRPDTKIKPRKPSRKDKDGLQPRAFNFREL